MHTKIEIATHYAGAVIWRRHGSGIELLLIDSKPILEEFKRKPTLTKFPGGTNRECPTEGILDTLRREVLEETDLWIRKSHRPLHIHEDYPTRDHMRKFYLVDSRECDGVLRKVIKIDDGDELSVPRWVHVTDVSRNLFHKHHVALARALKAIHA